MSTLPPYTNITGISRAAMKDNAQVSAVQYNGVARPAELVVEQNLLNLYAGDNNGNLVLLANANATKFYGEYIDLTTQTNTNVGHGIPVRYNTFIRGNHVTVVDGSKITMDFAGVYNIQFSFQMHKTDAGTDTAFIWLSKNGNTVANSNTGITMQGLGAKYVAAWNFVVEAAAGDYYEIMWGSIDPKMQIFYDPTPTLGPAIPSTIVTVAQV